MPLAILHHCLICGVALSVWRPLAAALYDADPLFMMGIYFFLFPPIWLFFLPHYGPGVDSASNRNEYQEYFLGVMAADA
jgi:hypothetical protein